LGQIRIEIACIRVWSARFHKLGREVKGAGIPGGILRLRRRPANGATARPVVAARERERETERERGRERERGERGERSKRGRLSGISSLPSDSSSPPKSYYIIIIIMMMMMMMMIIIIIIISSSTKQQHDHVLQKNSSMTCEKT
jgi:hypothetical protein